VVLWSHKSVESNWVIDEAANAYRRDMLVPVLIDDIDPPLGFGELQAAKLIHFTGDRNDGQFRDLCTALQAKIASRPLAGNVTDTATPTVRGLNSPATVSPDATLSDAIGNRARAISTGAALSTESRTFLWPGGK